MHGVQHCPFVPLEGSWNNTLSVLFPIHPTVHCRPCSIVQTAALRSSAAAVKLSYETSGDARPWMLSIRWVCTCIQVVLARVGGGGRRGLEQRMAVLVPFCCWHFEHLMDLVSPQHTHIKTVTMSTMARTCLGQRAAWPSNITNSIAFGTSNRDERCCGKINYRPTRFCQSQCKPKKALLGAYKHHHEGLIGAT